MADSQLQTILNSGDISSVYLGGTTVADKLLKSSEVDAKIAALEDGKVQENIEAIAVINNSGMSVLGGNALTPQTIAVTPTPVVSFDTLSIEVGVGTTGSVLNQSMTADVNGVYKLRYESFLSYASNIDITWQIYKNGVPFGNAITLAGQGSKVFPIVLISAAYLLAGDELKLYGTASASTDITVAQANGTLEKTYF